jgi:hypothetical protein
MERSVLSYLRRDNVKKLLKWTAVEVSKVIEYA